MDVGILLFVGAVVVLIGFGFYEKGKVNKAAEPTTVRYGNSEAARDAIDRAAVKMRLHRTNWRENADGWVQAVYPPQKGRDPYRIEIAVSTDGRALLVLEPEGARRGFMMGFIPSGPAIPFGTDQFLRLVKLVESAKPATYGTPLRSTSRPATGRPSPAVSTRSGKAPLPPTAVTGQTRGADSREAILAAFGAQRRCSFDWIDQEVRGDLLGTLSALQDLVDDGELVREPGGTYRLVPSKERSA